MTISKGKTITNTSGKIIIIGDLHGCYNEAISLFDKCSASENDTIIFLGDLVDRGYDPLGCVNLAMKHECLIGNHENKHILYEDKKKVMTHPHHIETRSKLTSTHIDYFRSLPHYIRLPQYNVVCVHAGVFPNKTIEDQAPDHLMNIQSINPSISEYTEWPSYADVKNGWKFWTQFWTGQERIVFGHSVLDKPLHTDKFVGLDGGVCFGRKLYALVLPDDKIVTVNANMKYSNKQRNRKYLIHDDVYTF